MLAITMTKLAHSLRFLVCSKDSFWPKGKIIHLAKASVLVLYMDSSSHARHLGAKLGLNFPVIGKKESVMNLSRVGVDLAKNVFQLHGVDRHEKVVWKRRLSRAKWLQVLLEQVEPGCEMSCHVCH